MCFRRLAVKSAFLLPGGFDSAVRFAHVLAQPALPCLKLVEPGCDEGAARVETSCVWLGTGVGFWVAGWGGGFESAVRFARALTQPTSGSEVLAGWLNQLA